MNDTTAEEKDIEIIKMVGRMLSDEEREGNIFLDVYQKGKSDGKKEGLNFALTVFSEGFDFKYNLCSTCNLILLNIRDSKYILEDEIKKLKGEGEENG